jgi:3-oxoacyl-[acyl-carrier-protein] synthase II
VLGEGSAVLVLEEAGVAHMRGAPVIGEIVGVGMSNDAHHITSPEPDGSGFAAAIHSALAEAQIEPDAVDYVNAHGTSTPANDRVETLALKRALGARADSVPISSTKSAIGHLLGAAGAIDAVATLEALRRGVGPPTLGYGEVDAELDLDYIPGMPRALAARHLSADRSRFIGLSNAAGFGGHNTAICFAA